MKKTNYIILFCFVLFSCERDYNNPYDRECPPEIWTPENLTATYTKTGVVLTWEQESDHFDYFLVESSTDSLSWDSLSTCDSDSRQFTDTDFAQGITHYRVSGVADKNKSSYGHTKIDIDCLCDKSKLASFTDSRDEHTYKTVEIGTQTWMAENLAYLTSVSPPTKSSYTSACYYVYGYSGSSVSEATTTVNYYAYGVLYNWTAATTACPEGWHLPTDAEWTILEDYLIANGYNYDGTTTVNKITKSLAASTNWTSSTIAGSPGNDTISNNASCFSALPGGFRYRTDTFLSVNSSGNWWSATPNGSERAWYRNIYNTSTYVYRGSAKEANLKMEDGLSVRCVKD